MSRLLRKDEGLRTQEVWSHHPTTGMIIPTKTPDPSSGAHTEGQARCANARGGESCLARDPETPSLTYLRMRDGVRSVMHASQTRQKP